MNLNHLYPFAGDHAIQSMIFAVEFPFENVTGAGLNLSELGKAVKSKLDGEFPSLEDVMAFTMSLTAPSGNMPPQNAAGQSHISGFMLKGSTNSLGWPVRSITLSPESLLIQINDYTRWSAVRADMRRYLTVLMGLIGERQTVTAVGLQVVDQFNWKSNPEDLDMTKVFRADGTMLPSHVFRLQGLWHSHHGYLTQRMQPTAGQQLDNINVSRVVIDGGVNALQIVGSHRVQFPTPTPICTVEQVDQVMILHDALHEDNKTVLRDLLTDGVLEKLKGFSEFSTNGE